jgi:hypothetical protein
MAETAKMSDAAALAGYMIFPLWGLTNAGTKWQWYYGKIPKGHNQMYRDDELTPRYRAIIYEHVRGGLQAESRDIIDTRMGRFFPGMAYCGGVTLNPGTYTITINYYADDDLVGTDRRENVQVQAGRLNLIESMNFKGIDLPEFEKSY